MTVRLDMSGHADYSHEPGQLYDCPRCENQCFCAQVQAGQIDDAENTEPTICVHCELESEAQQIRAARRFGSRS